MKHLKSIIAFILPIAAVVLGKELYEWMGGVPNMDSVAVFLVISIIGSIFIAWVRYDL